MFSRVLLLFMVLASSYAIKESNFLDSLVDDPTEFLDETEDVLSERRKHGPYALDPFEDVLSERKPGRLHNSEDVLSERKPGRLHNSENVLSERKPGRWHPSDALSERFLDLRLVYPRVAAFDEDEDPLVKKPEFKMRPFGIRNPWIGTKLALKDSDDEDVGFNDEDVGFNDVDDSQTDVQESPNHMSGSRVIRLPYRLLQWLLRRWGPVDATLDKEMPVKRIVLRVPHSVYQRLIRNEVDPEMFNSGIAPWQGNHIAHLPRWLLNPYRRRFNRNMIFLNDEDEGTMDTKEE